MKRKDIRSIKKKMFKKITETYIDNNNLTDLLYNTLISERKRLREEKKEREYRKDLKLVKSIQKNLIKSDKEIKILKDISKHYTKEIANVLNPIIYKISSILLPFPLALILNEISIKQVIKNPLKLLSVKKNIIIKGEFETLKKLSKSGTVIIVPTHVSNLDSPVIAWSTNYLKLPPFLYGAGLDSFENAIFNFFMTRIGAYSIDRKKDSLLYKKILKEYAIFSIENGYENLFFPGGTRSRSGRIENKLKKGLLGTGLYALRNNFKNNTSNSLTKLKKNNNVYYIPLNLSYESVLEDESLISHYLKQKSNKKKDKISEFMELAIFLYKMIKINSKIILNFSSPLDPFGNDVNKEGESIDLNGNIIDKKKYFYQDHELIKNEKNNQKYTSDLAKSIIKKYKKNNTIMRVHFISYIAFKLFRDTNSHLEFEDFINNKGSIKAVNLDVFYRIGRKNLKKIRTEFYDKQIDLDEEMQVETIYEILDYVLEYFYKFKAKNLLYIEDDKLYCKNLKLLYYYHNRVIQLDD